MVDPTKFKIKIENPKGSYKSFETEGDPVWSPYPLKGVTYPVDYGYIEGYTGEDGAELDIFVGSSSLDGYIVVWRLDVPTETKFFINVSVDELNSIKKEFAPVLKETKVLNNEDFDLMISQFKNK